MGTHVLHHLGDVKTHLETSYPIFGPSIEKAEAIVAYIQSEDMVELYVVSRARLGSNVLTSTLVLPIVTLAESCVTQIRNLGGSPKIPSRETVENHTSNFVQLSTAQLRLLGHVVLSMGEVIEQHWTLAQWQILGRGPYEDLSGPEAKLQVLEQLEVRRQAFVGSSVFRQYEFMAMIRKTNLVLYEDFIQLSSSVVPTMDDCATNPGPGPGPTLVVPGWFYYCPEFRHWKPFEQFEMRRLERQYLAKPESPDVVLVHEGRYQVNLKTMTRTPVYWSQDIDPAVSVHRTIWFYDERNFELQPYLSPASLELERAYAFFNANLSMNHETLTIPIEGHCVEFRSTLDIVQWKRLLFAQTSAHHPPFTSRRRVYRGQPRLSSTERLTWHQMLEENTQVIRNEEKYVRNEQPRDDSDPEEKPIEHLIFVIHGMGDTVQNVRLGVMELHSIVQCADHLRSNHAALIRESRGQRVEVLPVEWHTKLHQQDIQESMNALTLPNVSKLRAFVNDTLLDVLYFMSPVYHQVIVTQVAEEMNRIYDLFMHHHPDFSGKVSFVAHSLGAMICFDILANQPSERDRCDGFSSPTTEYPILNFNVEHFFACGSPIAMFLQVRGETLDPQYSFPTCRRFYNIFHPYDPVAYLMQPLMRHTRTSGERPTFKIIPTFEGRLRYQYQLKQSITRGWRALRFWKRNFEQQAQEGAEWIGLLDQEEFRQSCSRRVSSSHHRQSWKGLSTGRDTPPTPLVLSYSTSSTYVKYGQLCQGQPIDYSLQENELEMPHEYLFALTAHTIYWTNKDLAFFISQQLTK